MNTSAGIMAAGGVALWVLVLGAAALLRGKSGAGPRLARAVTALCLVNLFSMLAMNTGVLSVRWLPLVYLAALAAGWGISARLAFDAAFRPRFSLSPTLRRWLLLGGTALIAVLALARISYLLEPALHQSAASLCYDDYGHILQLNSLVNSPRYPPVSPFGPGGAPYLDYYYAVLMLPAALYRACPWGGCTLKVAYALTLLVYQAATVGLCLALPVYLLPNRRSYAIFLYLLTAYAGMKSVIALLGPLRDSEWWMKDTLGIPLQFPTFVSSLLWVPQHIMAGVSLALAYLIFRAAQRAPAWARVAAVAGLLANAFYSSAFVDIGALPFILLLVILEKKRLRELLTLLLVTAALVWPVLWLYLGDGPQWRLWLLPSASNPTQYLLVAVLVALELSVPLLLLTWAWRQGRRLSRTQSFALALAGVVYASAWVIAFKGPNYGMRTTMVPYVVLCYCAAVAAHRVPLRGHFTWVLAALLAAGSLNHIARELAIQYYQFTAACTDPQTIARQRVLYTLNADRATTSLARVDVTGVQRTDYDLVEKLLTFPWQSCWMRPDETTGPGPQGVWGYQRWKR